MIIIATSNSAGHFQIQDIGQVLGLNINDHPTRTQTFPKAVNDNDNMFFQFIIFQAGLFIHT